MKYLNVIGVTEAVQAGTAIAQTVAQISDMNKRRRFEESLALLTNSQKQQLEEKLLKANTQTARLAILSEGIVQYAISNDTNVAKKDTVMYVIAGGLAAVILTGAIIYAVKRKS